MSRMRDHHERGESFGDALALITASLGDNDGQCAVLRLEVLRGIVEDDVPEAGTRLAAATEMLAGLAAAILEGWSADSGVDAADLLQDFALEHELRFPR